MSDEPTGSPTNPSRVSRRGVIGAAAGGLAVAGAAFGGGFATSRATDAAPATPPGPAPAYPFHGEHQAGIVTEAQDRLHFASFDLTTDSRDRVVRLLQRWTEAAARLTQGGYAGPKGPTSGGYDLPPDDTGETIGLPASGLTLTFGFGPSLFTTADGRDRFGLAARQPERLQRLPKFPGDNLDPRQSDGDLCVQACAHDPQVAVHAIHNLARIAMGTAGLRWSQLGFGRTSSTSQTQQTPRNLFGFKDGTANLKAEETDGLAKHLWVPAGRDPREDWLAGGTYMVARRINMHMETWDRESLRGQERIIGRTKLEGAPMSGGTEFDMPDFQRAGRGNKPLIDPASHVALAHPANNDGVRMLRRGYNFVDGSNELGRMNAGLFFIAYVTDPQTHYVPMQNRMAKSDLLQEYLQHTGSSLWAIPPGVREGEYVGHRLFA
ncbi:iron uptake transporter deferrochelatase/peroxidase subunit [Mariniluteicoccus endophyticus]